MPSEAHLQMRLIITVEKNTEIAKNILKGWQYLVYTRSCHSLLNIFFAAIKKYRTEKVGNITTFVQEGDKEFIALEKRRFENFMFADEGELNSDKYRNYRRMTNDKIIQRVLKGAHKFKSKIKNKAIRAAMGGNDVLSFFTKLGIYVKWEVKE